MSAEDGKVVYKVVADDSGLGTQLDEAEKTIQTKTSAWEKLSYGALGKIGGLATDAALQAGKAIIQYGTEFEQSLSGASTLIDTNVTDMDALRGKLLDLSDSSGVSASELNNALYSALSAGIPATEDMSEALGFLGSSTKLAKAGFTDIDTAVSTTAKVLNAYGMDVSETERVQKILMQTQNEGITTVDELGSVLAQVTPTASSMGVSFEQVGASLATMTASGTPAAQATTQLNSLFSELGKSGTLASDNLAAAAANTEYAGMSFQDMMAAGVPLNEVLGLMGDYASDNGLSMLDMFSSIEAGKAALSMTGDASQTFTDNLEAMSTETDVVGEAYDKVTNTSGAKFNEFLNEVINMAIELFDSFKPLIDEALPFLMELFEELYPVFQSAIDIISILAQQALGVLKSAFDNMQPAISTLKTILDGLLKFITGVFSGDWRQAWDGIVEIFKGIFNIIPDTVESVVNGVIDMINGLIRGVNSISENIGISLPTISHVTLPRLQTGIDYVMDDWTPAYLDRGEMVLTKEDAAFMRASGGVDGIQHTISGMWNDTTQNQIGGAYAFELHGDVTMDGFKVGKVVLRNLDDASSFTLRG